MKEHMFYETVPSALAKGILTLNDIEMTFPLPGPSQGETRLKKKKASHGAILSKVNRITPELKTHHFSFFTAFLLFSL